MLSLPLIEKGKFDSHLHQNHFVRLGAKKEELKVKSALGSTTPGKVMWESITNVVGVYTGEPCFCGIRSRLAGWGDWRSCGAGSPMAPHAEHRLPVTPRKSPLQPSLPSPPHLPLYFPMESKIYSSLSPFLKQNNLFQEKQGFAIINTSTLEILTCKAMLVRNNLISYSYQQGCDKPALRWTERYFVPNSNLHP